MNNCLVDLSKSSCNIANPSEECKSIIECATSKKDYFTAWLDIIVDEVEEKFLLPAIGVALLLIYRLGEVFEVGKNKKE